jgi:cobalt-zinc-cadmium efflux system membrane fusion protein
MQLAWSTSLRNPNRTLLLIGVAAVAGLCGWKLLPVLGRLRMQPVVDSSLQQTTPATQAESSVEESSNPNTIVFAEDSWKAAGIEMQTVAASSFTEQIELTGKVTLNEDSVTHIFPLVDGRVDEVRIRFGQKVKKGELLLVVQSKEVGHAMLKLSQNRLQLGFAVTRDQWIQTVAENTKLLLKLIRDEAPIEEMEKQLKDRPLGEYRDRLMTAYIQNYKSQKHLERLSPLSKEGVVAGKQLLEAETDWKASRATLQSLVEQIQQDAQQAAIVSSQTVKELQTSVSVDETSLKILGFEDKDLENIDPEKQGETIAHYPIYSPFDGTVISKDAVLFERVGPERQILSIADLSTVWITTDIYEEHLPLLNQLEGQTIYLHSNAWPDKKFEARIFYTGDVVNEASRTISMRALADNRDGFLKPGMFLTVEFPNVSPADVLQVPDAAVLDHEGQSFVFVHVSGDDFERRDVTRGRRNEGSIEIVSGLKPGDVVVTNGGFALKSQMLSELLAE